MGDVREQARTRAAAAKSKADALALLNPERLLALADGWRRLAHRWTEKSKDCEPQWAEPLRTRAQLALFAAHEADELFKLRERVAGRSESN